MNQDKIAFAVLDIETTPFSDNLSFERIEQMEFLLACIIFFDMNGQEIKECRQSFLSVKELCSFLMSNCSKLPIYVHNLSFDFKFIATELLSLNSHFKIINTPSKTLCVKFFNKKRVKSKKATKSVDLRDSLSLLLSSVESLGKNINLPKLKVVNNAYANKKYCFRDCEIVGYSLFNLINFVKEMFKNVDITPRKIPLTIGSLAKKCFMSIYPEAFYKYDWKIHDYMRKHYFGGRTEVFDFNKIKNGKIMDIVSLYPDMCCRYLLPADKCYLFALDDYSIEQYCKFHNNKEKNFHIFGFECVIKENQEIPLFFQRLDKRVVCSNGIKRVFITIHELCELKQLNYLDNLITIVKPINVIGSKKLSTYGKFFKPLVKVKQSTESKSERYFCKIFMNSITGKFGQKPERKDVVYYNTKEIDTTKDFYYDIDLDCSYTERKYIQHYQTANLMIVIGITNLARFTLWKQIKKLRDNNKAVYYCDTDSIAIDNDSIELFDIGNNLGQWNIEHDDIQFQAVDAKEYIFTENKKSTVKFKGLITKHFKTSDFYQHYNSGTITRLIPKIHYCDIRKIPYESVVFLRKEKRQFYFKRLITKELKTIPLNTVNLNISSVKKHNRDIIYNHVILPNMIPCEVS